MSLFVRDLVERALKTFVQTFLAALWGPGVADAVSGKGIPSLSAVQAAGLAAVGAGLSIVTNLLSKRFGDPNTGSLVLGVTELPDTAA